MPRRSCVSCIPEYHYKKACVWLCHTIHTPVNTRSPLYCLAVRGMDQSCMFLSLEDCAAVVSSCLLSPCSAWALQVFAYCGRLISQGVYSELLERPDKCWWLVVGPVFVARVCDESFRKCTRTGMGKGTGTGTGTGEGTDTCPGMGKGTGTGPGTV